MSNTIFLVKFVEKEQYAIDFVSGKLYCNTLRTIKSLESDGRRGRADKNEGTVAWFQPGLGRLELVGMDVTDDLSGPVQLQKLWLDDLHVF